MGRTTLRDVRESTAERYEALISIARAVGEGAAPTELADRAADHIAHLVGDAVTIWLLPVGGTELVCVATTHPLPEGRRLLRQIQDSAGTRSTDGVTKPVLASGEPLIVRDFDPATAEVNEAYQPWMERFGASSMVILPVRARGRVIGALGVTRDGGRPRYSDEDVAFMQALVDVAGVSLDNAHLLAFHTQTNEELRRTHELVAEVADAVVELDPDGTITEWRATAERAYGYTAQQAIGRDSDHLLRTRYFGAGGHDDELDPATVMAAVRAEGRWRGETRQLRADGGTVDMLCSITMLADPSGMPLGLVAVSRDITEHRLQEHLARHDALTGLPNRRVLTPALLGRCLTGTAGDDRGEGRDGAGPAPLAVLFIDLDRFKPINDDFGHAVGDEVLRVIARRLRLTTRGADLVVRFGGDEFVVVLKRTDREAAWEAAQRLFAVVTEPIRIGRELFHLTASIGIACSGADGTGQDLLHAADRAMYHAKHERAGVAFAS